MAGMNLKIGVQDAELDNLLKKIQRLQKDLAKIDIRVNPEGFKELESQLQKAQSDFEALYLKINEAKFKPTVDISELVKLQEEILKIRSQFLDNEIHPDTPKGKSANSQMVDKQNKLNKGLEEYAKQQAVLSNEAKKLADTVLGSYNENIKALSKIDGELKKVTSAKNLLNKSEKDGLTTTSEAIKQRASLIDMEMKLKASKNELQAILRNEIKQMHTSEGSIQSMALQLNRLQNTYDNLNVAERNSAQGKALLNHIKQTEQEFLKLNQTMNAGKMMGAAGGFNTLNFQIQQVARELPSLTMGAQMFFLAISNNLPMLTDEIKKAKTEYNAMTAAGQKGVPVWKQLLSGILSWQTALVVGITLVTLYGKEIGSFVSGLFGAKKSIEELAKEQKEAIDINKELVKSYNQAINSMSEASKRGAQSAQDEITKLKLLYDATQDLERPMSERKKAVDELQKIYPSYLSNISDEDFLAGKAATAYNNLTTAILKSANAKAAFDKLVENKKSIIDIKQLLLSDNELPNKYRGTGNLRNQTYGVESLIQQFGRSKTPEQLLKEGLITINDKYDEYVKPFATEIKRLNDINQKLADSINIDDLTFDSSGDKKDAKGYNKDLKDRKTAREKQSLQDIRAAKDLEFQITEAEIKAMDEGSAKVLAQMKFNYEKEKEALKRQQEDILKSRKDNARAVFEADAKNKDKYFDDTSIKLTEEELKKYNKIQKKNDESYQNDKLNLELQYMRDYIKEYGTFQQRKLAIAQEYDKKIAASSNEWDKKSLRAQREKAISAIDFEAINKRIDWQGVFGNMTGMLESQLKETLSGLKEYVKTDQFRDSSDTDKKTVYDAIERLRGAIPGGQGTIDFNVIRQQMDGLGAAIKELQTATLNEKTAYENLDKAQKEYDNALKSGSHTIIESAKQNLSASKISANEASDTYKKAESNVQDLGNSFKETATDTIDGLNLVADGLNGFASNSLPQMFKGLQNTIAGLSKLNIGGTVGEAIGELSTALGSAGTAGQIISAVLSILDILKDGIGTLVSNLIDAVLNAVNGILKDILSFDITIKIANSLKEGLSNILNTISFGGFNSLVSSINGSNAKETAETISKLTSSNEALKVSVDALKDEMSGTNGIKSIKAYNEAVSAQKRYNENFRNILDAQMNYHGSHHSNAYYWNLDPNSLKEVNKLLGTSLNNAWSDFSKLTADQMDEIRKHLPDVWSEMMSQGKYGDRFKEDWNNYADQAGKVAEMTEELRENIAQISFDSLRNSFVDALMDMESDAEDFADNFEEIMMRSLLNFAIGDLLDDELKKWYDSWTDTINKQGGTLTPEQMAQYNKEWDDFVQRGIDKRNEIAERTGYTGKDSSTNQQASSGGYETMSQDTGEALEGRATAMQMSLISIDENVKHIAQWNQPISDKLSLDSMSMPLITLSESSLRIERMIEENRTIAINSYYELRDINKNTKQLYEMNEKLGNIEKNTEGLIR